MGSNWFPVCSGPVDFLLVPVGCGLVMVRLAPNWFQWVSGWLVRLVSNLFRFVSVFVLVLFVSGLFQLVSC